VNNACKHHKLFLVFSLCLGLKGVYGQYKEVVIRDSVELAQYKQNIIDDIAAQNTSKLADHYKAIGNYYFIKSQQDSAFEYFNLAAKQFENLKDSFNLSFCRLRMGAQIAHNGLSLNDALHWLLPVAAWFERNQQYNLAAHANHNISNAYLQAGMLDLRSKHLNKAKQLNKLAKDTLLDIIMLIGNAIDLRDQNQLAPSLAEAQKALVLARQGNYYFFQKIALVNLTETYVRMDKLAEAKKRLDEAMLIKHTGHQFELTYTLALYHSKANNPTKALNYIQLLRKMSDSTIKAKEKQKYHELIVKYDTEKRENEIKSLKIENELKDKIASRRKNFIAMLTAALGLVFISAWLIFRNINSKRKMQIQLAQQQEQFNRRLEEEKQQKQIAEFNKQLAEVQVTALTAQMNPHFLFNCMNSIQKYILKNEKAKALEFLQNFSDLMRKVLDNSASSKISLEDEINMLDKYIFLEQQRLDYNFDYTIDITEDIQADFFEIPSMIIQPHVENSIWHGLMNIPHDTHHPDRKGKLCVKFFKKEATLFCVIEDNGVGRKKAAVIEKQKSPRHKSYGMGLVQKRLQLLHMSNVETPNITIEDVFEKDQISGTRVTISIATD
jgi:preprotein translocase subunit SecG